jgi:hypothetical protein
MAGIIEVLATGKGHDELKLPDDKAEAKKQVDGLIAKGYTIMVTVGDGDAKTEKKVTEFDGETGDYIIKEKVTKTVTEDAVLRVPSASAKATAIAPTAGG